MTTLQVGALLLALLTLVTLVRILRSGHIREKYAGLWIVVGLAVATLAAFPGLLETMTRLTGFQVGSNLLFFLAILLLLGVSLHLSLEVSKLEDEARVLAEEVALLNERVARLDGGPEPR